MKYIYRIFFASIFSIVSSVAAQEKNVEQSENEQTVHNEAEWPELEPVFSDDFSKDSTPDYKIEGDVVWKEGVLSLNEGSSMERKIDGGPWVKVALDLERMELTEIPPEQELKIWFILNNSTDCYVRIRTEYDGKKCVGLMALVEIGEKEGVPVEGVVRESKTLDPLLNSITIEYRQGYVELTQAGNCKMAAFCVKGDVSCAALKLESTCQTTQISSLTVKATEREKRSYSKAELEELVKVIAADEEFYRLYEAGKYVEALRIAEQILKVRERILGRSHAYYATSLNNVAALYAQLSEYSHAEPLTLQSLEISKNVLGESHPDYAQSLSNLAVLYDSIGKYSLAEQLHIRAIGIRKNAFGKKHPDYAQSLNNLGLLYYSKCDYSRAEPLLIEAVSIRKHLFGEKHVNYTTSLNNLALVYGSNGDFAKAEPLFKQILEIEAKILGENHPSYATSLNNAAAMYELMGDLVKAEKLYTQAIGIQKKVFGKEHPSNAMSLDNLAVLYKKQLKYAQSERLALEAQRIFKGYFGEEHPDYAKSLNNLSDLYMSIGQLDDAEALLIRSRDIRKNVLGEQHPDYAASLLNLTNLYAMKGDYLRSKEAVETGFDIQLAWADKLLVSMSEAEALVWMKSKGPRLDLLLHNQRLSEQQNVEQAYYAVWRTKSAVSRLSVGLAPDENASPEVQKVVDRLRDTRLRLAKLISTNPNPTNAKQYREAIVRATRNKETLEKELASVYPPSKREMEIRDATITQLVSRLPTGVAVIDFSLVYDWEFENSEISFENIDGSSEIRKVKQPKTALVYDAFILRNNDEMKPKWVQLGKAALIDQAVKKWRIQLTGESVHSNNSDNPNLSNNSRDSNAAFMLKNLVWSKLEPHLDGCHTLIILPDGDLNRIPWAALPGKKPGSFLIEEYSISTANYGQQLYGLLSDNSPDTDQLLVAGGIHYNKKPIVENSKEFRSTSRTLDVSKEDRSWSQLDGAAEEAQEVLKLWNDRARVINLAGNSASEDVVSQQLEKSRFAHLATHGFFDKAASIYPVNLREQPAFETTSFGQQGASVAARNPLLMTGIVLAGANIEPEKDDLGLPIGRDGILTAEEIVGLNLRNLDLVTLSACETGLGDVAAGEGVFGLQRALHQAGARSVIASLWKVDDNATRALMVEFYRNLWVKKMSKVEALRQAQIAMINRYDLRTGKLRGPDKKTKLADADIKKIREKPETEGNKVLHPRFWAAFQLSGDWR